MVRPDLRSGQAPVQPAPRTGGYGRVVPLPPLVIMGVSGSGKTTAAQELAGRIDGARFLDADDYHSAANVAKMAAGIPLDDVARAPWLTAVGRAMRETTEQGATPVMACSALRRAYRQRIRAEEPEAFFVLLDVARPELERRMHARRGHFMPVSLLDSQLATLEPLTAGEPGITVRVTAPVGQVADGMLARIAAAR